MARTHVGLASLTGGLERYAERFDLLELRPGEQTMPRAATLRGWRKQVPPSFVFSVVLPPVVARLKTGPELDRALAETLSVARELQARCIVLTTPPEVTPTEANRKRLAQLVEQLPRDAVTLAWEPRGLWELDEAALLASKLGLVLVVDASREEVPRGPIAYVRLRGLGESSRLGPQVIEKVAERLREARESFVIIESGSPAQVAQALVRAAAATRSSKKPTAVLRPRATLRAEDEEQ
jgi:uncharacterized protein YecE (DUF72 family)